MMAGMWLCRRQLGMLRSKLPHSGLLQPSVVCEDANFVTDNSQVPSSEIDKGCREGICVVSRPSFNKPTLLTTVFVASPSLLDDFAELNRGQLPNYHSQTVTCERGQTDR